MGGFLFPHTLLTVRGGILVRMSESPFATRPHEKMQEVLLYPDAPGPKDHYFMIRGGSEKGNITVWETGTVGGEYIKTYGHYHVDDLPEIYWTLSGEGIALLQRRVEENGVPVNDRIEEFRAVFVSAGHELHIPARWGHLVVNIGDTFLITKDDSPVAGIGDSASMPLHADYKPVQEMKGFAYFVVEHEGKPALVRNPRYKEVHREDLAGLPVIK